MPLIMNPGASAPNSSVTVTVPVPLPMHPQQVPTQAKQPPAQPAPPPQPHPDAYQPKSPPPQEEEVGTQATIMPHSGVGLSASPNRPKKMSRDEVMIRYRFGDPKPLTEDEQRQFNDFVNDAAVSSMGEHHPSIPEFKKVDHYGIAKRLSKGNEDLARQSVIEFADRMGRRTTKAPIPNPSAYTNLVLRHIQNSLRSNLTDAEYYHKWSQDRRAEKNPEVFRERFLRHVKRAGDVGLGVKEAVDRVRASSSQVHGIADILHKEGKIRPVTVYNTRGKTTRWYHSSVETPVMPPKTISEESLTRAAEMRKSGMSVPEITKVIGIKPNAMYHWLKKVMPADSPVDSRFIPPDERDTIVQMVSQGKKQREIAKDLGMSEFAISSRIKGLQRRGVLPSGDARKRKPQREDSEEVGVARYARTSGLKKIVSGHYQYAHESGKKFIITRDVMRNGKTTWLVHKQNGPTPDHYGHPFDAGGSLEEAVSYCKPDEETPSKKRRYERPRLFFLRNTPERYAADDIDFSMMGSPEEEGGGDPYERPLPPEVEDAVRHQVSNMIGTDSRGVQDVDHNQFVNELSQRRGPHRVGYVMTTQYTMGKQLRSPHTFPEFNGKDHPGLVHKVVRGTAMVNVKYDDAMLRALVKDGRLPEDVLPMVGKKSLAEINSWLDSKGIKNPFEPGKTWSKASLDQDKNPKLTPFSHHESDAERQHYMRVSHTNPISEEYFNFQGHPLDFETEVAPFMADRTIAREGGVGFKLFKPGNVHAVKVGGHVLLKAPFLHTGIKEEGDGDRSVKKSRRYAAGDSIDEMRDAHRNRQKAAYEEYMRNLPPEPAKRLNPDSPDDEFEARVASAMKKGVGVHREEQPVAPPAPAPDESPITVVRSPRPGMQTHKDVMKSVGGVQSGPSRDLRVAMLANGYGKQDVERAANIIGQLRTGGHSVLNGNQRDLEIAKQLRDLGLAHFHAVTAGGKLQNIYVAKTRDHAKALADAHVEDHQLLHEIWKAVRHNIWKETKVLYKDADLHNPEIAKKVWEYAAMRGAKARAAGATGRTLDEQARDVIARMRARANYNPKTEVGQRLEGTGGQRFRRRYGRRIAAMVRRYAEREAHPTHEGGAVRRPAGTGDEPSESVERRTHDTMRVVPPTAEQLAQKADLLRAVGGKQAASANSGTLAELMKRVAEAKKKKKMSATTARKDGNVPQPQKPPAMKAPAGGMVVREGAKGPKGEVYSGGIYYTGGRVIPKVGRVI